MAITAYPKPVTPITTDQWRDFFREIVGSGVLLASDFRPYGDSTGLNVKFTPGFGAVDGVAMKSTAIESRPIGAGSGGGLSRIDTLVANLDYGTNPIVQFTVLKGVPAASGAAAPSLALTGGIVARFPIADIAVSPTAATITALDVTDRRAFLSTNVGTWTTGLRPGGRIGMFGFNQSTGKWEGHNGAGWSNLTPAWVDIAGRPDVFPPESHSQPFTTITGQIDNSQLPPRLRTDYNLGPGPQPDNLLESGWYSGYQWYGAPFADIAVLEVVRYSNGWIFQRLTAVSATQEVVTRAFYNGTTWSPWRAPAFVPVTDPRLTDARTPLAHDINSHPGVLAVSNGGTGANSAAQARANLGITPAGIGAQPAGNYQPAGAYIQENQSATLGNTTIGALGVGSIASSFTRNHQVTNNYVSVYSDGATYLLGYAPSARRFKRDIQPWQEDVVKLLGIEPKLYRLVADPDDAPLRIGFIAEDLVAAGLEELVPIQSDPDAEDYGLPISITYEFYVVVLQMIARHQAAQIAAIEKRLTKAGIK